MRHWLTSCSWGGCVLGVVLLTAIPSHAEQSGAVLVLMDNTADSELSLIGLEEELGNELRIDVRWVNDDTSAASIGAALNEVRPRAVVLKGARSSRLYRDALGLLDKGQAPPAAVVIGGFHYGVKALDLPNAVTLSDHVAGITSFVNLRAITKAPIRRVGVIYREGAEGFIRGQAALALQEKIELVGRSVRTEHVQRDLSKTLGELLGGDTVDALWVLDDDALLSPTLVEQAWLPALRQHAKPVVVNSPKLVAPQVRFGMFAVLPDHIALGARAAEQILDLQVGGWQVSGDEVATSVSVRKVLLLAIQDDHLALRAGVLRQMDQVIE